MSKIKLKNNFNIAQILRVCHGGRLEPDLTEGPEVLTMTLQYNASYVKSLLLFVLTILT